MNKTYRDFKLLKPENYRELLNRILILQIENTLCLIGLLI